MKKRLVASLLSLILLGSIASASALAPSCQNEKAAALPCTGNNDALMMILSSSLQNDSTCPTSASNYNNLWSYINSLLSGNKNTCPTDNSCEAGVSCPDASCPNGGCTNGSCTDASCPNGGCANGDCPDASCPNGGCANGSCTETPKPEIPTLPDVPGAETPGTTQPGETPETPAQSVSSYEEQVVVLVNKERAKYGLAPLTLSVKISSLARLKSQDMHDNNYFAHNSPTYGSAFDMLKSNGVAYKVAGENIAYGYSSAEAVVAAWMASESHRKNILNASYTQIGVGHVADRNYCTQIFIG